MTGLLDGLLDISNIRAAFFDMDGVLAVYERAAYAKPDGGGPAIFEQEHLHYYRTCRPDPKALELMKTIHDAGVPVCALTSVKPSIPWARFDKAWWLQKHAPWLDLSQSLIIANGDKAQMVKAREGLAWLDDGILLIDDFNPNLYDWAGAGGKAVKYLNGVNSPGTFQGPHIDARGATLRTWP